MVFDSGYVMEFDSLDNLLVCKDSFFYSMVKNVGLVVDIWGGKLVFFLVILEFLWDFISRFGLVFS